MIPLINGRAYDFAQIIVDVLGVPIPSITEINYDEEQEKTNNKGAGNRPVSRGHGSIEASGSITMSMNDQEALRSAIFASDSTSEGSLLKIPAFDIKVVFLNDQGVQTHVLKNCEFTKDGVNGSEGDTDLVYTHDLILSHVKYR